MKKVKEMRDVNKDELEVEKETANEDILEVATMYDRKFDKRQL